MDVDQIEILEGIVPSVVISSDALTSVSSVTPPVAVVKALSMVGASLVPVMVTVTSWVTVPPG